MEPEPPFLLLFLFFFLFFKIFIRLWYPGYRYRHILKKVKNVTDRNPGHTKTVHFLPADFENGSF